MHGRQLLRFISSICAATPYSRLSPPSLGLHVCKSPLCRIKLYAACLRSSWQSFINVLAQPTSPFSLSFFPALSISLSLRLALVHVCGFSAAGATFSDRQSVKWVMQKRKRSRRGWLPYMHTQFWACTKRNDQSICCAKYSSFNYFSLSIKSIKSSKFAYILWEKSLKTIDSKWKSVALSNHQYYRLFYFIMLYKSFNGARLASRIPF